MSSRAMLEREPKVKGDRRPRVNLCGVCGEEISETELLCKDCRRMDDGIRQELGVSDELA